MTYMGRADWQIKRIFCTPLIISIMIISYIIRNMYADDFMNSYIYKREDFSNPIWPKKKTLMEYIFLVFLEWSKNIKLKLIFLAFLHKCSLQASVSHCGQVSSPGPSDFVPFWHSTSTWRWVWRIFKPQNSVSISNWTKYRSSNAQNIVPQIIINYLVVWIGRII